jgi:hypothetical protein
VTLDLTPQAPRAPAMDEQSRAIAHQVRGAPT